MQQMKANPRLQEQSKLLATQLEEMMADQQTKAFAEQIEGMENRVIELEKQMTRVEERKVPMVANLREPTREEVEQHNLTRAN